MAQDDISFTDLMASSIHDMKNSLNVQISALEKIAAQCKAHGDTQDYTDLGGVIYQANRMNANLIQLLSLYKLDKAIYPVDIAECPVAELIEDALAMYRPVMAFKDIGVEVDCDADCYWYLDRDLMTGVLLNALNNAFHYTRDRIRIAARIDGSSLELRVEDNGQGYPAHMLRDERVNASAAGVNFRTGSTGLGFYFSAQVARVHKNGGRQGMLIIENGGAWGGGCFVVRLP
ncbi:Histidine kinase-, DNA gyrase B-, and HSP90-like ATPase [Paenacidovorax caeni]|jgi:signal transduction histidine kinase|uniref:Histidine kinase-, DNA gyrase B-, and HSP90-like ATPase n=1 Tax=Paenacidovorax caeni TaxID=343013 RepID=A0A1I7F2D3_9BURK|nr:HAMP domain-containing sensor histidine kinase [Paenacidovorax caeni]SFU30411.1 Histidine kinase-, DNA gyrase B-, and HSP90-like ATPase [Paenacidovorax caeni]